jgi:hypothetical protein
MRKPQGMFLLFGRPGCREGEERVVLYLPFEVLNAQLCRSHHRSGLPEMDGGEKRKRMFRK